MIPGLADYGDAIPGKPRASGDDPPDAFHAYLPVS